MDDLGCVARKPDLVKLRVKNKCADQPARISLGICAV